VTVQIDWELAGLVQSAGAAVGIIDDQRFRGDLERFKQLIEARGDETGAWRGTVDRPNER
jgi:hypothetical protein